MRTAATKLSGQEYEKLREYAEGQESSVSAVIRELVQGVTGGRFQPRPTKDSNAGVRGKIPYCPHCGFIMFFDFYHQALACVKCGHYYKIKAPRWQRGEPLKI